MKTLLFIRLIFKMAVYLAIWFWAAFQIVVNDLMIAIPAVFIFSMLIFLTWDEFKKEYKRGNV